MKKIYYILTLLLCVYLQTANAQMSINSTGASPNTAAMLDVSSTNKGFMMPRITTAQRNLMPTVANGLMIFNTTTGEIEVYRTSTSSWVTASRIGVPFLLSGSVALGSSGVVDATNTGTGTAGLFTAGSGDGVRGFSTSGIGVYGFSSSNTGVSGFSSTGTALAGIAAGSGYGVTASSASGIAIYGEGGTTGLYGRTNGGTGTGVYGATDSFRGVWGRGLTTGDGVYGDATSGKGIYGVSSAGGTGVYGQSVSGNGGFFTSTTGTALGITGAGNGSSSSSSTSPILRMGITNDSNYGWVRFENSTGARHFSQRYDLFGTTAPLNNYSLYYGSDQLFTVSGDGRFGLNSSSPLDLLHLKPITSTGDVYARISTTTGLGGLRLQNAGGDWSLYSNEFSKLFLGYSSDNFASNNEILVFEPNGANYNVIPATSNQVFLGTSGNRWREIWSQNPLNTSSDRRLKKNINEIKYGLDEIMKLQAVTYNWKDNDDKKLQLGFIAQDVEKIVPEIVTKSGISDEEFERLEKKGEKVTDTYGMQYTGLIPVLVKAIQEQQKVIEDKTNRISQLESKLQKMNDLEARLNLIEALMNNPKSETRTSINDK